MELAFFEYLERETSDAIGKLFHGFSGYVQADAKSVFDALFEPPDKNQDGCKRSEVGCWSHARQKFWAYLRDLIRVVPHWPGVRFLELAPLFWNATRLRLNSKELDAEYGLLTIPEPSSTEQSTPR